jgi:signal transduction histidine kinase
MRNADSPAEVELLNEIRSTFKQYQNHLSDSLAKARLMVGGDPSRALGQDVGLDLESLLALTEELTAINRNAAERFMSDTNAALTRLQRFVFASLLGLLVCGAAIIFLIYRRTIAPLRNTLTESRALLERQEKLASLGVFATGIAHEIRNPLTAIKVRLFTLKNSRQPDTSEHEDIEVIGAEIDRLEHIVRDFLQFARPAEPEFQTLPVNQLLQEVHMLLQSDLVARSVSLKLEQHTNQLIRVDPSKMKQVLINFVQNGAESMVGDGTVTLCSRQDRQLLNGRLANVVVIDVTDTGSGIPPEVQKRLFDPFFTTKEAGTGLGLPIAARIVEKHGGVIQFRTQPQRGTTFSIVLPSASKYENQP